MSNGISVWYKVRNAEGNFSTDEAPVYLPPGSLYHDVKCKIKQAAGLEEPLMDLKLFKRDAKTDKLQEAVAPRAVVDPSFSFCLVQPLTKPSPPVIAAPPPQIIRLPSAHEHAQTPPSRSTASQGSVKAIVRRRSLPRKSSATSSYAPTATPPRELARRQFEIDQSLPYIQSPVPPSPPPHQSSNAWQKRPVHRQQQQQQQQQQQKQKQTRQKQQQQQQQQRQQQQQQTRQQQHHQHQQQPPPQTKKRKRLNSTSSSASQPTSALKKRATTSSASSPLHISTLFECPVRGCHLVYKLEATLQTHMKAKHRNAHATRGLLREPLMCAGAPLQGDLAALLRQMKKIKKKTVVSVEKVCGELKNASLQRAVDERYVDFLNRKQAMPARNGTQALAQYMVSVIWGYRGESHSTFALKFAGICYHLCEQFQSSAWRGTDDAERALALQGKLVLNKIHDKDFFKSIQTMVQKKTVEQPVLEVCQHFLAWKRQRG